MPIPAPNNPSPSYQPQVQYLAPVIPARIIVSHRGIGRWLWWTGWLAFLVVLGMLYQTRSAYQSYLQTNSPIEEHFYSLATDGTDKVAIINVEGAIMHSDGFVKWQIDRVREDKDVKAVVLRVDSPGGTVTGSDYIYRQLLKLTNERKIPLVVSMGGIAASGGSYIAMAVGNTPDTIYCEPTTWTGSIGVIIPHYDVSELIEKWNIKDDSIVSHPLKQMLSPTKKLSPEMQEKERQILQALVDDAFAGFKSVVKAGRPKLSDDQIKEIATGQVFSANQAKANGLVDQFGFLDDAIDKAIKLANLDKSKTRAVKYDHPSGLIKIVVGPNEQANASIGGLNLAALLELTAPRAYFLCTWLPAAVANQPQ